MRVVVHHSANYDKVPVPADVEVTKEDIASGRVKPDKANGGYTTQILRKVPSHTTINFAESTIVAKLIYELIPRPGRRKLGMCNRSQLVAELLDDEIMPNHAHPKHYTKFEVENDDGPDEKLCREQLAIFTNAQHHMTGDRLIDPADVEKIVAKYLEPTTHQSHVDHLHGRFGVAKAS
jgi:hypothetical protein